MSTTTIVLATVLAAVAGWVVLTYNSLISSRLKDKFFWETDDKDRQVPTVKF